VGQFIMESGTVFRRSKITLDQSPIADSLSDPADQSSYSSFPLGSAESAVQIFAGNNVGCGNRPVFGHLNIFLLEDDVAFGIGDLGRALFPFDLLIRRNARLGEPATEGQTWSLSADG